MNAQTEQTPAEKIAAWMEAHGVTVEATFVPYSLSRNAKPSADRDGKPWPSLNWSVRIMKAGREVLTTDYGSGTGHTPAYKASKEKIERAALFAHLSESSARADMIAWEIEHGKEVTGHSTLGWSGRNPIMPNACDVMHSLVSDASVLDEGGFEAWAESLGYDTDSRKAEAIYRACLEIALKLRAALGDEGLAALRDAAQDY